jgi:helix-turn-helix protein
MPRNTTTPEAILALSPSATARALGVRAERVQEAIDAGHLVVRQIGVKRRIAVSDIMTWFSTWPIAQRK